VISIYQKKGTFSSFCAIFQEKKDHEIRRSYFEIQGLPFLNCPCPPPGIYEALKTFGRPFEHLQTLGKLSTSSFLQFSLI